MNPVDELIAKAEESESSGNVEQAVSVWRMIAELKPTARAFARLGQLEEELGRWEDAERAFRRAEAIKPSWHFPLTCLAMLDLSRTDVAKGIALEQAKANLLKSIKLEGTPVAWSMFGSVQRELGMEAEARSAFEKALELDPTYTEAAFNLAELEEEHNPDLAKSLIEKVLALDPDYAGAHQSYGKLLQKEGKLADAIRQFEASVKSYPEDYWSYLYLANALAVFGNRSGAEAAFRKALQIDPENAAGLKFFDKFLEEA